MIKNIEENRDFLYCQNTKSVSGNDHLKFCIFAQDTAVNIDQKSNYFVSHTICGIRNGGQLIADQPFHAFCFTPRFLAKSFKSNNIEDYSEFDMLFEQLVLFTDQNLCPNGTYFCNPYIFCQIQRIMNIIKQLTESRAPMRSCMVRSEFMHLNSIVFNSIFTSKLINNKKEEDGSNLISVALDYIHINYADLNLTDSLCAELEISKKRLFSLFEGFVGISMINYIRKVRIDLACKDIAYTNLPINEIAIKNGFSDQSYFTKIFKKEKSITPDAYRTFSINSRRKLLRPE